jgi:molecular chaperone DnaK (HSP70)
MSAGIAFSKKPNIMTCALITTCFYLGIADTAERSKEAHKAVLAVPLNTPKSVLDRTKEAAEAAGLEVLQIISEPCAATLAYQVGLQDPSQNWYILKLIKRCKLIN